MRRKNLSSYTKGLIIGGVAGLIISLVTVENETLKFLGYIPMKIAELFGCQSWECAGIYTITSIIIWALVGALIESMLTKGRK